MGQPNPLHCGSTIVDASADNIPEGIVRGSSTLWCTRISPLTYFIPSPIVSPSSRTPDERAPRQTPLCQGLGWQMFVGGP